MITVQMVSPDMWQYATYRGGVKRPVEVRGERIMLQVDPWRV